MSRIQCKKFFDDKSEKNAIERAILNGPRLDEHTQTLTHAKKQALKQFAEDFDALLKALRNILGVPFNFIAYGEGNRRNLKKSAIDQFLYPHLKKFLEEFF